MHLASIAQAQAGEIACKSCGAEARIVPGCSFPEAEKEAFEELSGIVAEGSITPTEGRSLAVEIERALGSGSYRSLLATLSVRLPGLLPHEVAAGKNAGAQRRILAKLKTVFEALGTARRVSAEYPILADSPSRRAGRS
ncbi:MAG: hypothetical protein EOO73_11125 [Myxococcales bacterium]|nr:MAG: hypothetical protein EOO73_11125 [Myxococcales bacterium]